MIKVINKEGREAMVTKGVYDDLYKPLGYTIAPDKKPNETKPTDKNVNIEETEADKINDKVDEKDTKPSYKRK